MNANGSTNGHSNAPEQPRKGPVVIVQVTSDAANITPDNPNGVRVGSNIPRGDQEAILMTIMLLSEGIQQLVNLTRKAAPRQPVSNNIVLPDGSAAPLPLPESN